MKYLSRYIVLFLLFHCIHIWGQEEWKNYTKDSGLSSNNIDQYFIRSNGEIWLDTDKGINIFDGEKWIQKKKIKYPKSGKEKSIIGISYIWEDDSKGILIVSWNGIITYDGKNWKLIEKKWKGMPSTRYFMKDSKGNFWVCLQELMPYSGGVYSTKGQVFMFDGTELIDYSHITGGQRHNSLTGYKSYFTTLTEDKNNNIWIGNYDGAFRYDGKEWEVLKKKSGKIPDNEVTFIKEDHEGTIWIGTDNGLAHFINGEWRTYTQDDGFPGRSVYLLWQDAQNKYWAFTMSRTPYNVYKGVCILEDGKWIHQTDPNLTPYISSVENFGNGSVWASGKDGVSVYDGEQWKYFSLSDGIKEGYYGNLFKDSKNNIWAYSKKSVIRYDSTQWSYYTKETPEGVEWKIRFLKEDSHGNIWIGTNNIGIFKFDRTNWNHYDETSGLVDDKVKSLFEDKEGNIWIITKKGVSVYKYKLVNSL